ncbi:MAG: hypothetical protein Q8O67_15960 [Deltaproteobacteria bacterium]|nr:hypothetical protein [Deltaproteobacteria bacterium]
MGTTWTLRHQTTGSVLRVRCDEKVLTVELTPKDGPPRKEERTLRDPSTAYAAAERLAIERNARGFLLLQKAHDAPPPKPVEAAPTSTAEAGYRAARRVGAVERSGWLALACDEDGQALSATTIDDVIDTSLAAGNVDVVQLMVEAPTELGAEWLRALCSKRRKGLKALILDNHWQTESRQIDTPWGDLGEHLPKLPDLQKAVAVGVVDVTPFSHLLLADLTLNSSLLEPAVDGLIDSKLPALVSLGLCAGGEEEAAEDDVAAVLRLLASPALPALTQLDLGALGDPLAMLEVLARSSRLVGARPLTRLRFARSVFLDEDKAIARLVALAPAFKATEVGLPLDTFSDEGIAALTEAWTNLEDTSSEDDPFTPSRYSEG